MFIQKLFALNAAFQKMYFDSDNFFFSNAAPNILKEATELITSIDDNSNIDISALIKNCSRQLNDQIDKLKIANHLGNRQRDWALLDAKNSFTQVCWFLYDGLRNSPLFGKVV